MDERSCDKNREKQRNSVPVALSMETGAMGQGTVHTLGKGRKQAVCRAPQGGTLLGFSPVNSFQTSSP